jgi:SAM-dependent methyltransferase
MSPGSHPDTPQATTLRDPTHVVESMQDYYKRRAAYYERVYFKPERQTDLRAMEAWISGPFAGRNVLEVACGTGWWTPHGARDARHWLATDLNPETMDLARHKPGLPDCVQFEVVDAYSLDGLGNAGSTPPLPAAGGATCRWRACRLAGHAARAAAARRARGRSSTTASCRPAACRSRAATPRATPTRPARSTTAACTRC